MRHGNDPKLRLDYCGRTIQRARTSAARPTPRSAPMIPRVAWCGTSRSAFRTAGASGLLRRGRPLQFARMP